MRKEIEGSSTEFVSALEGSPSYKIQVIERREKELLEESKALEEEKSRLRKEVEEDKE